jgi:hypothetical protein
VSREPEAQPALQLDHVPGDPLTSRSDLCQDVEADGEDDGRGAVRGGEWLLMDPVHRGGDDMIQCCTLAMQ